MVVIVMRQEYGDIYVILGNILFVFFPSLFYLAKRRKEEECRKGKPGADGYRRYPSAVGEGVAALCLAGYALSFASLLVVMGRPGEAEELERM